MGVLEHDVITAIGLPVCRAPLVTVVIPVCGNSGRTMQCLASISRVPPGLPFEVIVVHDGAPDDALAALEKAGVIHRVYAPEGVGFIRACNLAAQAARGDYLCFLGSDTAVTAGWLDELWRTFQEFPGTGLAGSKFTHVDGSLQEAGGIVAYGRSVIARGHLQNSLLPEYNYAREVDYCSAASIMVPKALFAALGGFNPKLPPADRADVDLALRVRDAGYRVIYQPLSTVVRDHHMHDNERVGSAGACRPETTARWNERDDAGECMAGRRVLVIEHCTLTPDQDSGSAMVFNLLLLLREMNFQVTFIPEENLVYAPGYTARLQRVGVEVLYAPYVTSVEQHLQESGARYDLVFLFRPGVYLRHFATVRQYCPHAKTLYHTVDLHYLRLQREAQMRNDAAGLAWAAEMKQLELGAMRAVNASIVLSTAELEMLRRELPTEKIHLFPMIMDVRGTDRGYPARRDIIFVGGYRHPPNIDAVRFFALEVMPHLRGRLPGVRFHAAGSNPPAEILELACEDVIIHGFVAELNPLLDSMRISVAPLRYGAGIKGKIGTAMASGLPVVATSIAAEGMSLTDGANILVADGAPAIASTVARLYDDEVLWNRLSRAGLAFADEAWGAEPAWRTLARILTDIGIAVERGAHGLSLYAEGRDHAPSAGGESAFARPGAGLPELA